MAKRLTNPFLQHLLQQFNDGQIDGAEASYQLQISRAHLYRLRTRWLQQRSEFAAQRSGGGHWPAWPPPASQFLKAFVPLQKPPNFQLVADELARRFGFQRHRQSVAAFVRTHCPDRYDLESLRALSPALSPARLALGWVHRWPESLWP